jgi:hypothetical protein
MTYMRTQKEILDGVLKEVPWVSNVSIGEDLANPYSVQVHVILKRWTWIALGLLHLLAKHKLENMFSRGGVVGIFYQVKVT